MRTKYRSKRLFLVPRHMYFTVVSSLRSIDELAVSWSSGRSPSPSMWLFRIALELFPLPAYSCRLVFRLLLEELEEEPSVRSSTSTIKVSKVPSRETKDIVIIVQKRQNTLHLMKYTWIVRCYSAFCWSCDRDYRRGWDSVVPHLFGSLAAILYLPNTWKHRSFL